MTGTPPARSPAKGPSSCGFTTSTMRPSRRAASETPVPRWATTRRSSSSDRPVVAGVAPGHGADVQGVGEAAPLHAGEAGGARLGHQLVHAHRVDREGRTAVVGGDGERDGHAQVGGVLAPRAAQELLRHPGRRPQGPGRRPGRGARPGPTTAASRSPGATRAQELPHGGEPHGELVGHARGRERLRRVAQRLLGDGATPPRKRPSLVEPAPGFTARTRGSAAVTRSPRPRARPARWRAACRRPARRGRG